MKILSYCFSFILFQSLLWITIFETSCVNDSRYFVDEAWKWSETINQPYFNIEGKREVLSSLEDSYLISVFGHPGIIGPENQYFGHYFASPITDSLKSETGLVEGNYPSSDNEILVTKRFHRREDFEDLTVIGRKIKFEQHEYSISGILDTHIRYDLIHFEPGSNYDPKVNDLDYSFIFTENEFDRLFVPCAAVVKVNSKKQLISLNKRKNVKIVYSIQIPSQTGPLLRLQISAENILPLVSALFAAAYLVIYLITKHKEAYTPFSIKEAILFSAAFLALDFVLVLILDIIGKDIYHASTFYYSLGITSLLILAFLILALLVRYLPNIIYAVKEKRKAKYYHYDLRNPNQ